MGDKVEDNNLSNATLIEKPRVVIFGAGGVGGYLAARLAESGHSYVHVIARGPHLKAIQENDNRIILKSIDGDCSPQLDSIGDTVESVLKTATTPVDAVIFTCKMDQLAAAAEAVLPLFSEKTIALPTQNGVEAPEVLAKVVGAQRVVGGYVQVLAYISTPGVILHEDISPTIYGTGVLTDSAPFVSEQLKKLECAFVGAKETRLIIHQDVLQNMYRKLTVMAAYSGVCSAARCNLGQLRSIPETLALVENCMNEVVDVAKARGIMIGREVVRSSIDYLVHHVKDSATPSMFRDIASGKPSELEWQVGAVVRQGHKYGVSTPYLSAIYAILLPTEIANRKKYEQRKEHMNE
ncbi:hypothetical protein GpartN1_g7048.t1 [Galdieria partita]|uniref:2-dehydropantoate 2-reductase n=1 Tax=Galdieria partita TaxID=83374 RepID=A0A9C7Q321_9RHOD|nr:hypothetical protein GpartN1_g6448.t1 [Galdieria partita]GJQ15257.1 hypothetical protein GpartN1_g7048.t1 [Galdieria partita]